MRSGRPLHHRAMIWLGTAAVAWALVLVGRQVTGADDHGDGVGADPAAQQLSCAANQLDANGHCL